MYCIKCGNKLDNSYKYCTNCGNKITNSNSNDNVLKCLSIILGCFSIVCSVFGIFGLLLGIFGLCFGIISKKNYNNKSGIIFSSIGITISLLFCILYMIIIIDFIKGNDYEYYAREKILSIF